MSLHLRWKTVLPYLVAILLGLALGPALSWLGGWLRPPAVQAAEVAPAAALAPDSPQAIHTCTPDYVAAFAARVLSILLTARSLGKNVRIYYTSAASGSAYGCSVSDCRPIDAAELLP